MHLSTRVRQTDPSCQAGESLQREAGSACGSFAKGGWVTREAPCWPARARAWTATRETFHSPPTPTCPTPLAIVSPSPFPPRTPAAFPTTWSQRVSALLGCSRLPQLPLTQTGGLPLDFRENRIPRSERPAQPSPAHIHSHWHEAPCAATSPSLTSRSEGRPPHCTSWNWFNNKRKKIWVEIKINQQQCFSWTSQSFFF